MRIQRLDATLANQIAAGEVVERPASVLKELLENSVDAGATRIDVEIERGGAKLVQVRDNGAGIAREDLMLALSRHATSKIRHFGDLAHIESLGFRGEALPSIASVARLALQSRPAGEESGWQVEAAGTAEIGAPAPVAHGIGTTVRVRDLFFNTPARRKFLRTEKTEFRHLENIVRNLALGHPDVEFALTHNARRILRLRPAAGAQGRDARVAKLCGTRFLEHALRIEFESGALALHGWVSGPRLPPRPSDPQYLFVNARPVRDPVVRHAIRAGCAGWLSADRPPAYVLHLALPAAAVDVNVHPTKHEVRFRDARLVHDFVARCLRGMGTDALHLPSLEGSPGDPALEPRSSLLPPAPAEGGVAEMPGPYRRAPSRGPREPREAAPPPAAARGRLALGPLGGRYLAVPAGDSLRLIDLRAARRAVFAARLRAAVEEGPAPSRPLLVPESFPLGPRQGDRLESCEALLVRLGFDLRRIGPERAMLREVPIALSGVGPRELSSALARALESVDPENPLDHVIRSLIEGLDGPGEVPDMDGLLHDLDALPAPPGSRSGRVWVDLSSDAIATLFKAHEGA